MTEYRLISSDSHVTMPDDAWQEYLDPEFRDRAPRIERTDEGDFRVFEGKRTPIMTLDNLAGKKPEEFSLNVRKLEDQRAGAGDPAARIDDMDTDGVDAEVLYVGGPLLSSDPALRLNSVRGYNRWLSDYASVRAAAPARHGGDPDRHAGARGGGDPVRGRAAGTRRRLHPAVPARRRLRRPEVGPDVGGLPRHRHADRPARRWPASGDAGRRTSTRARRGS